MTDSDARKRRDEKSREITKRLLERKPMSTKCPECHQSGRHNSSCSRYIMGNIPTEIGITHFVDSERSLLLEFLEYWIKNNASDPENFPMKLRHEDWAAQFANFAEVEKL